MAGTGGYNLPPKLSFEGNVHENWKRLKRHFIVYLGATGKDPDMTGKSDQEIKAVKKTKARTLLNVAGEEAIDVAATFNLSDEDLDDYEKLVQAFDNYAKPKTNETYERFVFNQCVQEEGEMYDHFLTRAKTLIKSCGYGEQEDSLLKDRIVIGVRDKKLRDSLLRVDNLKLEQAVLDCRAAERSKIYSKTLQSGASGPKELQVDALRFKKNTHQATKAKLPQTSSSDGKRGGDQSNFSGDQAKPCSKCNRFHKYGMCPAYCKSCLKCNGKNHFQACCPRNNGSKKIHEVEAEATEDPDDDEEEGFYCDHLSVSSMKKVNKCQEWRQDVIVNGHCISVKLDPGSNVNVMPLKVFESLNSGMPIQKVVSNIEVWEGGILKSLGKVKLPCRVNQFDVQIEFLVMQEYSTPLLSKQTCEKLNLVKRVHDVKSDRPVDNKEAFVKKHFEVFTGTGKYPGKHHINITPNAQQVIRPALRKPKIINERLKVALDKLEKQGFVEPVHDLAPGSFVSNMVIVEKPDSRVRICLDSSDLNKVIQRKPHLIPTVMEIQEKLANKSCYTVLDVRNGFYHIDLDEESRNLLCFATPFGLKIFTRLAFGVASAPEECQAKNEQLFGQIPNVQVYIDDIIVSGATEQEHDTALEAVIKKAKENNVRFNKNKLQYKQAQVKYVGQVFNKEGRASDPDRVKALLKVAVPNNRKELERVMGMFNYLRDFIANFSTIAAPLRLLQKNDVVWLWTSQQEQAFNNLKQAIAKAATLVNFDSDKKITVQADASQSGLGCCLAQEGQVVAYGSRSLTPSECNYSQSEKELLAIVFAMKKFHNMVYGYPVKVLTDHEPLLSVMKKRITQSTFSNFEKTTT